MLRKLKLFTAVAVVVTSAATASAAGPFTIGHPLIFPQALCPAAPVSEVRTRQNLRGKAEKQLNAAEFLVTFPLCILQAPLPRLPKLSQPNSAMIGVGRFGLSQVETY